MLQQILLKNIIYNFDIYSTIDEAGESTIIDIEEW